MPGKKLGPKKRTMPTPPREVYMRHKSFPSNKNGIWYVVKKPKPGDVLYVKKS